MDTYRIVFSVGKDRPGIVDDISTLLYEQGANIEDSRMAVMGGCFSSMVLFSCTPEQLESIQAALKRLEQVGLEISIHPAEGPTAPPVDPALPLRLDVKAMDHPGIVQRIVHILRTHDVNIQTLSTQVTQAPLSGAPLFGLTLEAAVPAEAPISKIKGALQALAAEINLDLHFKS
jgi:glycine cleavage system transcriptional repressor